MLTIVKYVPGLTSKELQLVDRYTDIFLEVLINFRINFLLRDGKWYRPWSVKTSPDYHAASSVLHNQKDVLTLSISPESIFLILLRIGLPVSWTDVTEMLLVASASPSSSQWCDVISTRSRKEPVLNCLHCGLMDFSNTEMTGRLSSLVQISSSFVSTDQQFLNQTSRHCSSGV